MSVFSSGTLESNFPLPILDEAKIKLFIDLKNLDENFIAIEIDKKSMSFQLSEKRKIDHRMLNLMRNEENIDVI